MRRQFIREDVSDSNAQQANNRVRVTGRRYPLPHGAVLSSYAYIVSSLAPRGSCGKVKIALGKETCRWVYECLCGFSALMSTVHDVLFISFCRPLAERATNAVSNLVSVGLER